MKKALIIFVTLLSALSAKAQYNYFEHLDEFLKARPLDSHEKNFSNISTIINYGVDCDSAFWMVNGVVGKDLNREDLDNCREVFLTSISQSGESYHQALDNDSIERFIIRTATDCDISPEANFIVMGHLISGPTSMSGILEHKQHKLTSDNDDFGISYLFNVVQKHFSTGKLGKSSLKMDQILKDVMKRNVPQVAKLAFDAPSEIDYMEYIYPNYKKAQKTYVVYYDFGLSKEYREIFEKLRAAMYEHLDYKERFSIEDNSFSEDVKDFCFSVRKPSKGNYISWIVRLRPQSYLENNKLQESYELTVSRAEGADGIYLPENYRSQLEKMLENQKENK